MKASAALLAAALAGPAAAAGGAPGVPQPLVGTWQVQRVGVDQADQPRWRYLPDDPRLRWRVLEVASTGALQFGAGREACAAPQWRRAAPRALSALVAARFPKRPPGPAGRSSPTLADFGLGLADRSAASWSAWCPPEGEPAAPRQAWAQAWWAPLSASQVLMAFDGDTLLLLERLAPGARPQASFNCAAAGLGTAEAAVCAHTALAGWDRSVAAAYARSQQRRPQDKAQLAEGQRAWLATRNACGADPACLEERQRERVEQLMQLD